MIYLLFVHFILSIQQTFDVSSKQSFLLENDDSECYYNRLFSTGILSNSVICIIQCRFNSIISQTNGGAVVISLRNRFGIKNLIDRCTFYGCKSKSGGAIYFNIEKKFTTEIINSVFQQNSVLEDNNNKNYGGAIYINSQIKCNFTSKNCSFILNSANDLGGSIYFSNLSWSFEDCIFTGNLAQSLYRDTYGGAILFSSSIGLFKNCSFINNLAYSFNKYSTFLFSLHSYGGAISSYGNSIQLDLDECSFVNNSAYSMLDSYGGAIYVNNKFTISKSKFHNNTAYSKSSNSYGGVVFSQSSSYYINTDVLLYDNIFINNRALSNTTSAYGGALRLLRINGLFRNCTFNNNTAETFLNTFLLTGDEPRSYGAAICISSSKISFNECKFINNTGFGNSPKHVSTGKGGAIFSESSVINIYTSIFNNNTLCNFGYKYDIDCYTEGGACYFSNTNSYISNCNFINNTAMIRASINSIYFSARIYGAAIYSHSSKEQLKCIKCLFTNNSVLIPNHKEKEFSGAVYLTNGTFDNCFFIDNSAYNGGDIRYDQNKNSLLKINGCTFKHTANQSHQIKSLIHCRLNYNIKLANEFTGNKVVTNILSYLFDGEIESENVSLKFKFKNNCMSPFDKGFYKSNSLSIYNELGNLYQTLELAFDSACNEDVINQTMPITITQTQQIKSPTPIQTVSYSAQTQQIITKTYTKSIPTITKTQQIRTQTHSKSIPVITKTKTQSKPIFTQTYTNPFTFVTQTDQIMTKTASKTSSFSLIDNKSGDTNGESKEFKKIFIMLITIMTILIILTLMVMGLFIMIFIKRRNGNDLVNPLIDFA